MSESDVRFEEACRGLPSTSSAGVPSGHAQRADGAAAARKRVRQGPTRCPLVEDTVARGTLQDDAAFFTGKSGTVVLDALPFPLTAEVLDRGEQRYNIYCSPCHGMAGTGDGMIVRRGYRQPPSYHTDRLRAAPIGHFYEVMTNGFGAMPDYRAQIAPRDRWAIAAYVRALQLSQHAPAAEFPPEERQKLSKPAAPAAPGGHK